MPAGIRRGTSFQWTLTGTNLADPIAVWTSFPAKATIPTDMNNGKDTTQFRVKLDVPADAPIGFHSIRVATKNGLSNARIFCVDDLPQVAELETNHTKATAQSVPVPCAIVGRTDAEVSDFFKIAVKPNQRLTFEVFGRRLGSAALDPVILFHDAKSGREIPGLYSDDAPGLQSDPRLTHTFKEAGEYLIEIRDTLHRGGSDFYYRLRIGDFPATIAAFPVGIKKGSKSAVNFAGPSIEGVAPIEVTAPADGSKSFINVAPKAGGNLGWPVPVFVSDRDELVQQGSNTELAKAQKIPVPCGVTGRFLNKEQNGFYVFPAKKGTKYIIATETMAIGSPAEIYLVLKDAKNADLAKSAPQNPTARIEYTATVDGDLYVVVENLFSRFGPNEIYHLIVRTVEPDFDVVLGLDRFSLAPGGSILIPINNVIRRDYTGPIELSVTGNSAFTGSTTVPAGIPAAPIPPPQPGQPVQPIALLPLIAKADVPVGAYELKVMAKATVNGKEIIRFANITDLVKQSMNGLPMPPLESLHSIGVAITDKPLFDLTTKPAPLEVFRGIPATLTITTKRQAGFVDEIAIAALALPPNVTAVVKPVGKGTNEVQIQITAATNAVEGKFNMIVRGTTKFQAKDYAYYSNVVPLTVVAPKVLFELKAAPSPLIVTPGQKAKLKVTAVRKDKFNGAIDVELRNLPANVTAVKAQIPPGKTEVEVEVSAAANAAAGDKPDVNATGISGKQAASSPNVIVRVAKDVKKK